MTRLLRLASSIAVVAGMAACTDDDAAPPESTVAETTTTVAPPEADDDAPLVLGALLPISDTQIGQPLLDAVRDAVDRVNRADGVLGQPVTLVVEDEGTTAATAASAVESLLESGVDAVIGPASSLAALNVLDDIVAADVLACSPTATALTLDDFPDRNLFVRTIPSDSLQASAIAQVVEDTGVPTAVVAYVDDGYGRPFAEAIEEAFSSRAVSLVETVPYAPGTEDLSAEARAVVESGANAAIVIGAGADSARFLDALAQQDVSGLVRVVVNDAIRDPGARQILADLDPGLRERVVGVAPQAVLDEGVPEEELDVRGPYVANAVDCVNLITLGAVEAGSTSGRSIAARIPDISADGSVCSAFDTCAAVIANDFNPNYDGPSGVIEIVDGEVSRARFIEFRLDDQGRDVRRTTFVHPG
jgi:branched-chain amino acid transport system substrate-binding protein